jgi:[acyl-carrier-protein] S-malonyltransferase
MTVAWIFPGQGSQVVGMGRDLYAQVPVARDVFDQADDVLDINISRLCFEGPAEDLTATENAQPALLTVSLALMRALETLMPPDMLRRPEAVAGHSLGEYSALVAGGGVDTATAIRLVRRRGELMAEAREGTMAAIIGLNEDVVGTICQNISEQVAAPVVIANYNAPGQLVISGASQAVTQACAAAKEQGAKRAIPLNVSAAFHSPLMTRAVEGMSEAMNAASISDMVVPLVANVTASPIYRASDIRGELIAQISAPVQWVNSVRSMVAQGITTFVEIGPGTVLTGLIKRIAPDVRLVNLRTVEDIQSFAAESR